MDDDLNLLREKIEKAEAAKDLAKQADVPQLIVKGLHEHIQFLHQRLTVLLAHQAGAYSDQIPHEKLEELGLDDEEIAIYRLFITSPGVIIPVAEIADHVIKEVPGNDRYLSRGRPIEKFFEKIRRFRNKVESLGSLTNARMRHDRCTSGYRWIPKGE